MTQIDTSTAAVQSLMDGVAPGLWRSIKAQIALVDQHGYYMRDINAEEAAFLCDAGELVRALLAERDALAAKLATARDDALAQAARLCDSLAKVAMSDARNHKPGTLAHDRCVTEKCLARRLAHDIRALKAPLGGKE